MVEKILNNRQLETMPQYIREQNDSSIIFTGKCLPPHQVITVIQLKGLQDQLVSVHLL